jgi:hypothetical protein
MTIELEFGAGVGSLLLASFDHELNHIETESLVRQ